MRMQFSPAQLRASWTLAEGDLRLLGDRTGAERLVFAVLLKYHQIDGGFPESRLDVPADAVTYLAEQLDVDESAFYSFWWRKRRIDRYAALIQPDGRAPDVRASAGLVRAGLVAGGGVVVLAGFLALFGSWTNSSPYRVEFAEAGADCSGGGALYLDSRTGQQLDCAQVSVPSLPDPSPPRAPWPWTDGEAGSIAARAESLSAGGLDATKRAEIEHEVELIGEEHGYPPDRGSGWFVAALITGIVGLAALGGACVARFRRGRPGGAAS